MKRIDANCPKEMKKLRAGDIALLCGTIFTARDSALKKISEEKNFPKILENSIIFHAGPTEKNKKKMFSCGPTTSKRMDSFLPMLFRHNLFATIGKGERDIAIHKKSGKMYFTALGGLGSLYGSRIISMEPVLFKELKSEAVYRLEVRDFPVIVAIDGKGKSIFNRSYNG
ncbi:MAG: fumarate hydratase C-terminal domain-containing protein [bacterium]|nr:fumarate hydratase C-terminal domain-containing protein [bacterium]